MKIKNIILFCLFLASAAPGEIVFTIGKAAPGEIVLTIGKQDGLAKINDNFYGIYYKICKNNYTRYYINHKESYIPSFYGNGPRINIVCGLAYCSHGNKNPEVIGYVNEEKSKTAYEVISLKGLLTSDLAVKFLLQLGLIENRDNQPINQPALNRAMKEKINDAIQHIKDKFGFDGVSNYYAKYQPRDEKVLPNKIRTPGDDFMEKGLNRIRKLWSWKWCWDACDCITGPHTSHRSFGWAVMQKLEEIKALCSDN